MAGSHESNPNIELASKKSKSKSGKSGQDVHQTGKSGKKHKSVSFSEEPSSKRQRVEDDLSVYKDGPLEVVYSTFENTKPYFTNGIFVDMEKLEELGLVI